MIRELEQADALSLDDQRLARRHARTALAISGLHTLICLFYFQGGYIVASGPTLAVLLAGIWAGNLLMTLLVLPLLLRAFPMSAAAATGLRHGLGGSTEAVPSPTFTDFTGLPLAST